jgi:hypothetical protein
MSERTNPMAGFYDDDEMLDDGRPRLPQKIRYYDNEPQEPPVDPTLLDWAKREKTIIAEHAAARRMVR